MWIPFGMVRFWFVKCAHVHDSRKKGVIDFDNCPAIVEGKFGHAID